MFLQIWDEIAINYADNLSRLDRLKEAVRQLEESGTITEEQQDDASEDGVSNSICDNGSSETSAVEVAQLPKPKTQQMIEPTTRLMAQPATQSMSQPATQSTSQSVTRPTSQSKTHIQVRGM